MVRIRTQLPKLCLTVACVVVQLIELKNGDTYNGHMVNCDAWMNINLREVICTSRVSPAGRTRLLGCLNVV